MLALVPAALAVIVVYLGCMLWTVRLSFTSSKMLPTLDFVGFDQYARLFSNARFLVSVENLVVFGALFLIGCLVLGFLLAAFIDQRVRAEGVLRTIYLYPHAMSFIVTGLVWQWFLNPTLGLQKLMHDAGWQSFTFDWLVNKEMVVYTLVIAGDLAVRRADHGDPAGGPAGRRRGPLESGAGRRHPDLARLFLDRAADPAADADHLDRPARDRGGQGLRPRGRDDPGRAGHRLRDAGQVRHGSPVRARQRRPRHGLRHVHAGHRDRGAGALALLAVRGAGPGGGRHDRRRAVRPPPAASDLGPDRRLRLPARSPPPSSCCRSGSCS